MKNVVIWGAASGLGASMVNYYHAQGFNVIAVARDPAKNSQLAELNIPTLSCDATQLDGVKSAVSALPKDAWIISTMGSFRADIPVDYIGHRNLINSLEEAQIKRFLLVTSLGCGDSWQYLSERSKIGFGSAVREKSLAESWLQTSSLDYTIVRPGGLQNGDMSHQGQLSQGKEVHGLINRSEVARLTHQLLDDRSSIGEIYECVDPTCPMPTRS